MKITASAIAVLAVISLGTLATGTGQTKEPKKGDKDRLVGVWRVASGRANGKDLPTEISHVMRMNFTKDGKASMTVIDNVQEGPYKLSGPGQIEISLDKVERFLPGIYKFESDDRAVLCMSGTDERPTKFSGEKGEAQFLFVLVRAKAGEEKPTPTEVAKFADITKFKGDVNKIREATIRLMAVNNLKEIALAIHGYYNVNKTLPVQAIYSKDGKSALLS